MELRLFATVFVTIFVAELGDKTQLATLLYASRSPDAWLTVFLASGLALVVTSALGVLAGTLISQWINPKLLSWIVGGVFIAVGVWTIARTQL